jgi:hypothetical protein
MFTAAPITKPIPTKRHYVRDRDDPEREAVDRVPGPRAEQIRRSEAKDRHEQEQADRERRAAGLIEQVQHASQKGKQEPGTHRCQQERRRCPGAFVHCVNGHPKVVISLHRLRLLSPPPDLIVALIVPHRVRSLMFDFAFFL